MTLWVDKEPRRRRSVVRNPALDVVVEGDSLRIGPHFRVSFQRTLRIPDDGQTYPLPPGLGNFPIRRVADYADRVPAEWRERGGVFLPMYQREAMWLAFHCDWWRAVAVQVGIGKVCAITGRAWRERLNRTPARQNYVVCPDQPWLDGINAGDGFIRQFVAMPLGQGYTVEGQLTGEEKFGGVQIRVVEPRPGRFPEKPPKEHLDREWAGPADLLCCMVAETSMGLGAGGRMRQKIYPDPHGARTWDESNAGRVYVHIANSAAWTAITGEPLPPTPISAELYTRYGFPWFDLYDEKKGDLASSGVLKGVASIAEIDAEKGLPPDPEDATVDVAAGQVVGIGGKKVVDGQW
ncbi:MAG TPA: hypothetical protein VFH11_00280 [Gemmatimonadota bacterium]|nr:hypothetical protein [Gemmatimonadota bacterium]